MANSYLIALEGGGTRSQAALMDLDGTVYQIVDAGEVNTNFMPLEQAQANVRQAVQRVLSAAGISGQQVRQIVTSLVAVQFGAETFGALAPSACYTVYGEREVVFARAGIYQPHGVAVVASTGATVFGVRADDGRQVTLGGWGSLLGDEGSAYHLGLLGLRSAAMAWEGREQGETRLVEALSQHFGLSREHFQDDMIELAYGKPLTRSEIAGLAPLVTRLAQEGDEVAARLTNQVTGDLAALMMHAARRLFAPSENFDVVIAGGMVNAGDLLLEPLHNALSGEFPQAVLKTGNELPAVALGKLALFHSD